VVFSKLCIELIALVCIDSEPGMSPVPQSDSNGGTTINEILHETAKYGLKLLYNHVVDNNVCFFLY